MAVAYASVSTFTWGSITNTMTITKPTGLAAGDLMVACLVHNANNAMSASGWTALKREASNTDDCTILAKIADSTDAAASNFVFSNTGGTNSVSAGALWRITGAAADVTAITVGNFNSTTSGSSHTFTGGDITPQYASSLMLFLFRGYNSSGVADTTSAYAIATDNPTWTEVYDFNTTSDSGRILAGAYGSRPQVTASGHPSCSTSGNISGRVIMLAVPPPLSASVSADVVSFTATVQAPTVTGGANVSASVVTMVATVQAPTVSTPASKWLNTTKDVSSATNVAKSSSGGGELITNGTFESGGQTDYTGWTVNNEADPVPGDPDILYLQFANDAHPTAYQGITFVNGTVYTLTFDFLNPGADQQAGSFQVLQGDETSTNVVYEMTYADAQNTTFPVSVSVQFTADTSQPNAHRLTFFADDPLHEGAFNTSIDNVSLTASSTNWTNTSKHSATFTNTSKS